MVKVYTSGTMAKSMMESGKTGLSMAMEFGKGCLETLILESGDILRLRGMEYITGRLGIDMRESGSSV